MSIVIRPSSLPQFADCQRRSAARMFAIQIKEAGYTLREIASSVGASVGTATHTAVASCMTTKMNTGELGNQTEDEQRGVESLEQQIGYGVSWDPTTPNLSTGQRQVVRMYRSYRGTVAERVQPRAVERRLESRTRRGNILSGQPDLVDDGIRDQKTGVMHRVSLQQLGAYSLLVRAAGGEVLSLTEDYIQRVDIEKEQPEPVEFRYDVGLAERVAANTIADVEERYAKFVETGDNLVFRANPSSQLCSAKWCPCHSSTFCREHA